MKRILENFSSLQSALAVLAVILLTISVASISAYSIAGWDNFSASLNLPLSLERSFSYWREYRGLGVPSDSESADIPRIVAQLFLSLIIPDQYLDQVYYLVLYSVGVISVFFLTRSFLNEQDLRASSMVVHGSALISALFYGLNYHALETFLFPVMMYPVRFAFFPLVLLFALRILQKKPSPSKRDWLLFLIANIFLMPSFLTATVFITLLIGLLALWPSFFQSSKKILGLVCFVLLINSFWLFGFINYTFEKAPLIPRASSFVDVNELLLNKPSHLSSFKNILTFYPMTISREALPFTDLETGAPKAAIKILEEHQSPFVQTMLILPAVFAVMGAMLLIVASIKRKDVSGMWPILLFAGSIFLLRQLLPPTGRIYEIFSSNIPYFEVVFRFAGAKFNPLLLLAFSLLIGFFIFSILARLDHFRKYLLGKFAFGALIIVGSSIFILPFSQIFSDGLFHDLVKVSFPPAYKELVDSIHHTDSKGRVLHLPFDQHSYWRSYEWGYFGSSFLNFALINPLLDRTFEPASLENDYFFQALHHNSINYSNLSQEERVLRLKRLQRLLKIANVTSIIFDDSVSTRLVGQGLNAWGVFNTTDYQSLITDLQAAGSIELVAEFELQEGKRLFEYQTNFEPASVRTIREALLVDDLLENAFTDPLLDINQTIIQLSDSNDYRTYPFWQPLAQPLPYQGELIWRLPNQNPGEFSINVPAQGEWQIYDLFLLLGDSQLELFFQPRYAPISLEPSLGSASKIEFQLLEETHTNLEDYALRVDQTMIDLTDLSQSEINPLGAVLVKDSTQVSLLRKTEVGTISLDQIELTQQPNCFGGAGVNYQHSLIKADQAISLNTQSGMTCLTA